MDLIQYNQIVADKTNHKLIVIWACDCADRTLNYFEKEYTDDSNPREAIMAGRM